MKEFQLHWIVYRLCVCDWRRDVLETPRRKQPIGAPRNRENHHFWNGSSMGRVSKTHHKEVYSVVFCRMSRMHLPYHQSNGTLAFSEIRYLPSGAIRKQRPTSGPPFTQLMSCFWTNLSYPMAPPGHPLRCMDFTWELPLKRQFRRTIA